MLYGVSPDTVHLISTIKNAVENSTNSNNFVEDFAIAIDGSRLFSTEKRRQTLKPTKTRRKQKINLNLENSNKTIMSTTKCQIDKKKFIDPITISNEESVKNIVNLFLEIKPERKNVESSTKLI